MLEFLNNSKIYVDVADYKGMTTFNLLSTKNINIDANVTFTGLMNFLIDKGADIDKADLKGRTAFLNFVANNKKIEYSKMLDLGANIN